MQPLFSCQQEVGNNVMCHPVIRFGIRTLQAAQCLTEYPRPHSSARLQTSHKTAQSFFADGRHVVNKFIFSDSLSFQTMAEAILILYRYTLPATSRNLYLEFCMVIYQLRTQFHHLKEVKGSDLCSKGTP